MHTWRRRDYGLTCFSHLLKSQGLTATSNIHHRADLRGWGWNSDTEEKVGNDGGFDSFPFSAVIPKLVCWYIFKGCFVISPAIASLHAPVVVNYFVIPKPFFLFFFLFLSQLKKIPLGTSAMAFHPHTRISMVKFSCFSFSSPNVLCGRAVCSFPSLNVGDDQDPALHISRQGP